MVNKENVLMLLQQRADAQQQYITAIKDDIKLCNGRIVDSIVDFEITMPLVDTAFLSDLKTVKIPSEIFALIDAEYVKEDTEKYFDRKYKYYEVDGIRFRPEY